MTPPFTAADLDAFARDGFLKLPAVVPARSPTPPVTCCGSKIGLSPDDPAGWTSRSSGPPTTPDSAPSGRSSAHPAGRGPRPDRRAGPLEQAHHPGQHPGALPGPARRRGHRLAHRPQLRHTTGRRSPCGPAACSCSPCSPRWAPTTRPTRIRRQLPARHRRPAGRRRRPT